MFWIWVIKNKELRFLQIYHNLKALKMIGKTKQVF